MVAYLFKVKQEETENKLAKLLNQHYTNTLLTCITQIHAQAMTQQIHSTGRFLIPQTTFITSKEPSGTRRKENYFKCKKLKCFRNEIKHLKMQDARIAL